MRTLVLPEKRFNKYVNKSPDGCWLWTGGKNKRGYGAFWDGKRLVGAHQFSYQLYKGNLNGKFVCHSCDNPSCVNPAHLWLGTQKDNLNDAIKKGRNRKKDTYSKGVYSCRAKLKTNEPDEIRELYSTGLFGHRPLAKMYGVNRTTIKNIVLYKTYKEDYAYNHS